MAKMTEAQARKMFDLGIPMTRPTTECECGEKVPTENLRRVPELPKLLVAECETCGRKWGIWHG